MATFQSLQRQEPARKRLLTRAERSRLATLENPLPWSNFKKKLEKLNPDFDLEVVDRSLESDEALFDLKKKYPEIDIGLKERDQAEGFREFLEEMGIENVKLQNMIAMEDPPLSQQELDNLSYIVNMRSEQAVRTDKALKAPIAKDVRQWITTPNRVDIPTVDR